MYERSVFFQASVYIFQTIFMSLPVMIEEFIHLGTAARVQQIVLAYVIP